MKGMSHSLNIQCLCLPHGKNECMAKITDSGDGMLVMTLPIA